MKVKRSTELFLCVIGLSNGCAAEDAELVVGFTPQPAGPGITRYVTPAVRDVQPGEEVIYCQWLSTPFETAHDVLSSTGEQSRGGHHAVLYATTAAAPKGTTRPCTDADLTHLRFLGGVAGEGADQQIATLPEGVVYRLPAGMALVADVHYINYFEQPIDGQTVIDLEMVPVDPARKVASLFINSDGDIRIPANSEKSLDVYCDIAEEMDIILFGNHMHEFGKRTFTTVTRAGGTAEMIRQDDPWDEEAKFNPTFNRWSLEAPMKLGKGDRLHTHCSWHNDLSTELLFPREMCAGWGLYVGDGREHRCLGGTWEF